MASVQTPETRAALLALLDWYVESGVDLALDDAPHDRYADSARVPPPSVPPPSVAPRSVAAQGAADSAPASAPVPRRAAVAPAQAARPAAGRAPVIAPPDEAARAAQAAAASARSLDELAATLSDFAHAPFRDMARHFLFGTGAAGAPLMIFDAAPGATEESTGEAFNGLSARLLDNMLAAIVRNRESAWLAYAVPWRPPGDANPTPQQTAILAPFARRHVELARPRVLLMFGEAPARMMLETTEPLPKLRGRAFEIRCGDHVATGFVFNSLESILTSWSLKRTAWRDLRAAAAALAP